MKLLPDLLLYILLMIISSFFFFFSRVFSRSFAKSPEKENPPFFVQAASAAFSKCTIAFLCELSCFPVC